MHASSDSVVCLAPELSQLGIAKVKTHVGSMDVLLQSHFEHFRSVTKEKLNLSEAFLFGKCEVRQFKNSCASCCCCAFGCRSGASDGCASGPPAHSEEADHRRTPRKTWR